MKTYISKGMQRITFSIQPSFWPKLFWILVIFCGIMNSYAGFMETYPCIYFHTLQIVVLDNNSRSNGIIRTNHSDDLFFNSVQIFNAFNIIVEEVIRNILDLLSKLCFNMRLFEDKKNDSLQKMSC